MSNGSRSRAQVKVFLLSVIPMLIGGFALALYLAARGSDAGREPPPQSEPKIETVRTGEAVLSLGQRFTFSSGLVGVEGGDLKLNAWDLSAGDIDLLDEKDLDSLRRVPRGRAPDSLVWAIVEALLPVRSYGTWAHASKGRIYAIRIGPGGPYAAFQLTDLQRNPDGTYQSIAFRYKFQSNGSNKF